MRHAWLRCVKNASLISALLFTALLGFVFRPAFSEQQQPFKPGLHLRLSSGRSQMKIGDMNDHLNSLNAYYHLIGPLTTGQVDPLGTEKAGFQGELILDISRRFSFGLATSFIPSNRRESFITGPSLGDWTTTLDRTYRPELEVWAPIKASVYFYPYSSPVLRVALYSGLTVFTPKMKEEQIFCYRYANGDIYYDNRYWETDRQALAGWHLGAQLEFGLFKNLSLIASVEGCLAKDSSLSGSYKISQGSTPTVVDSGTGDLYFYGSPNYYYYDLMIGLPIVAEDDGGYAVTRKASLDLSGFSFQVGFKVRLF